MKKYLVTVFTLILSGFVNAGLISENIYQNDMSSLDDWSMKGQSGIYVVDDSAVKFNGLYSILSTQSIWTDTEYAIQDETEYVLTVTGATHSIFKSPLELSFSAVSGDSWDTITSQSLRWSQRNVTGDLVISFSTVGSDNDGYIGQSLGITLDAGWMNCLSVDNVSLMATSSAPAVPEPATVLLMAMCGVPVLMKRKVK